jgi:hypothetical protein
MRVEAVCEEDGGEDHASERSQEYGDPSDPLLSKRNDPSAIAHGIGWVAPVDRFGYLHRRGTSVGTSSMHSEPQSQSRSTPLDQE